MANVHLAMKQGLTIIPIINKIDLPNADIPSVKKQLEEILAIPAEEAILASAKARIGIEDILEAVIHRIPAPRQWEDDKLRALVFDSTFDVYRGVVTYVRVFSGAMQAGTMVKLMSTNRTYEIKEAGVFIPGMQSRERLDPGSVGYVIANIKSTADIKIGDTLTDARNSAAEALPGFQEIHPMVFSGIYPINTADFEHLKLAMGKLQINDSAFVYQAESSVALGFGFRCGFLGLLHMEIIQERLRREYDMDIIATYPSVIYEVQKTNGEVIEVDNPAHLPDGSVIEEIREPVVKAFIMVPNESISAIMQLIMDKRGEVDHTESLDTRRVMLSCVLPLNEILVDFNDKIKSITRGYGSMDYEHAGYRPSKQVKLDMLVNGEPVDAFSSIVHRDKAEARGRLLAAKLKEVIPHAALPGIDPGGDRRKNRRAGKRLGHAQERDGEVLRRRHHAETEAARETKGRQKADEIDRESEYPARGVYRGAEGELAGQPHAEPADHLLENFNESSKMAVCSEDGTPLVAPGRHMHQAPGISILKGRAMPRFDLEPTRSVTLEM